MQMSEANQKIKYLVADTTAFINAVQLQEYAENIYTVPDVMTEVRNKRQIRRLCVLPYDLQVREPTPESIQHCLDFSKKTGDYASLSGIDMKIIALTYELEKQYVGTDHLRLEPLVSKLVASKEKPAEFRESDRLPGWCNYRSENKKGGKSSTDERDSLSDEVENDSFKSDDENNKEKSDFSADEKDEDCKQNYSLPEEDFYPVDDSYALEEKDAIIKDYLQKSKQDYEELQEMFREFELCPLERENDIEKSSLVLTSATCSSEEDIKESLNSDGEYEEKQSSDNEEDDDDDDDSSWITPSNVHEMKRTFLGGKSEDTSVPLVACMSTDFAIQNTLRQMNLKVSALNGLVIKQNRTFILRCYACYKTTSIMSKLFCPNCGNKTLKKVAVSIDEEGKQVIHINTRRPLTKKYKNQSIPRFRGGKHSHNPILFEDQPLPRQMPSRVAKTKTNALDEDYTAGFSPFAARDTDSKSAVLRSKGHLGKQWSRNTRYEEERRRRNYNRLYK